MKHYIGKKLDYELMSRICDSAQTITGAKLWGDEYFYEAPGSERITYHQKRSKFEVVEEDGMYGTYLDRPDMECGMICVHVTDGIVTNIEYGGI